MKKSTATSTFSLIAASFLAAFLASATLGQDPTPPLEESAPPDGSVALERELCDEGVELDSLGFQPGSFTILIRLNILEKGGERGNDGTNGTICSVGTGYYDGFRLIYDWPNRRLLFQIGKKDGATGCASTPLTFGLTREIFAVCDDAEKKLVLYSDGFKIGEGSYPENLTTDGKPLKVGFNGNGVGSNRMVVDKVEYWKRALTQEEVEERSVLRPFDELKATAAIRALESYGSNAAFVGNIDDALKALDLDLPADAKTEIERLARIKSLAAGEYRAAAPLVFENAKNYRDAEVPKTESAPTLEELTVFGDVLSELRAVSENYASAAKQAKDLAWELKLKRPREAAVFAKIDILEKSADRVRKIEKDAVDTHKKTLARLSSGSNKRFLYVSSEGNDATGTGQKNAPFASLAKAFDSIKSTPGKPQTTIIEMAEGVYQVDRTATLTNAGNALVRPARGAKVVLTGGRKVDNFRPLALAAKDAKSVEDAIERFRPEVRDKIFVSNLFALGIKNVGSLANRGYGVGDKVAPIPSLYLEGESQTLARWPNDGEETLKFGEKVETENKNASTFKCDFDRFDSWKNLDDVWAFGLYEWEWAANLRKVLAIDKDKKEATFDYKDGSGRFDYYFVNVLEELDAPGEFFVDKKTGFLFFYPPEKFNGARKLNEANVEYDEFSDLFVKLENATDVLIQGISFKLGRESFGSMKNCKRCYIDSCDIEQFGGNVLTIKDGSFCGALNCRMRELGACGLRVSGGDRETLTPCCHLMRNNFVSDFSRIDRVYAPAIHAEGCGVAITNNLMCDSPHHAMRTDGNDMYVARNEIHSCVYEYSDQSGIDIYCDPTYRGIVIEKNLWRHIGSAFALCGQAGIRLDDSISGVVMLDNVFYRTSGGFFGAIQIHGGKDNLCKGNTMVDCKQAFSFSPWRNDRYLEFIRDRFPKYTKSEIYLKSYPFFDELEDHIDRNYVIDNLAVNCDKFNSNGDGLDLFVGNRSTSAKPDVTAYGIMDQTEDYGEVFYTNSNAMRLWLEKLSGLTLKDVGLQGRWNGANVDVTPKFRAIR